MALTDNSMGLSAADVAAVTNSGNGCCETVSVVNTSTQAIQVENANIIFTRPDLVVTR